MARGVELENRSILRLTGKDTTDFLQGLITNDIKGIDTQQAIYAGLLTPQGKFLFDMIIVQNNGDLFLDIEKSRKDDLFRRLMMYKLRADVNIIDESETLKVWAVFDHSNTDTDNNDKAASSIIYDDPRSSRMGKRIISNHAPAFTPMAYHEYEQQRLQNTIPDGSRDMKVEKYFWLETNAEALNGVDFDKGCYVGQELTARMKHRTTIKKSLITFISETDDLIADTSITNESGKTVGELHTVSGKIGIGYIRLEHVKTDTKLFAGDTMIIAQA